MFVLNDSWEKKHQYSKNPVKIRGSLDFCLFGYELNILALFSYTWCFKNQTDRADGL